MLRKKAQAKRDGKRVMVDESVADIAHKQAPPKRARAPRSTKLRALVLEKGTKGGANEPAPTIRAKAPRKKTIEPPPMEQEGANAEEEHSEDDSEAEYDPNSTKSFNDKRDRQKTPTEEELLEQMRKGVSWPPTRFADKRTLKELSIEDDIQEMLGYMSMSSFYTMAYPTYKEVSCQFLSSLEATFHTSKNVEQGWGMIHFKIDGRAYSMSFKEIEEVLGFQDQKDPSFPKLARVQREMNITHLTWRLLTGKTMSSNPDKNASIRHPSVRYLHRLLVHTLFPRKEVGTVFGDEVKFLHQAVQHYALQPHLPLVPSDFYKDFGIVDWDWWLDNTIACLPRDKLGI
ncbi:hypothetical protein Bca4012_065313 [Brassica carinata]